MNTKFLNWKDSHLNFPVLSFFAKRSTKRSREYIFDFLNKKAGNLFPALCYFFRMVLEYESYPSLDHRVFGIYSLYIINIR